MVSIARKLNAVVQGDDGEIYKSAKDAHKSPKTSEILRYFLALYYRRSLNLVTKWFYKPKSSSLPFKVGDKIIGQFGTIGTVKSIDRRAN
jgi:hypothetical protein